MTSSPLTAAQKKDVDRAIAALSEAAPILDKAEASGINVDEQRLRQADLMERLVRIKENFCGCSSRGES